MPHDDFYESTLIEFVQWGNKGEITIAKYKKFEDLPPNLKDHFKSNSDSNIILNDQSWKILEINKDLRAHGKGMHVKVRLESSSWMSINWSSLPIRLDIKK